MKKQSDFAERTIQITTPVLCDVVRRVMQLETLHDEYGLMGEECFKSARQTMYTIMGKCVDLVEKHGTDTSYFVWRRRRFEELEQEYENLLHILCSVPHMIRDKEKLEKSVSARYCWDDFMTYIEYSIDWIEYMQATPY